MLQLELNKPGQKLKLNIIKDGKFFIELSWSSPNDPDVHAMLACNDGSGAGAKVDDLAQVLSTYNVKGPKHPSAVLTKNSDGSFATPCGGLIHSGDSRTGKGKGVDELITVDTARIDPSRNEVPVFVTIHVEPGVKPIPFSAVKDCTITLKSEGGQILGQYVLAKEFGQFTAVQMGTLMKCDDGWEYAPVGAGFNGDFNTILQQFS